MTESVFEMQGAGIVGDPLDVVRNIKSLLSDLYKDAGDGRTLLRELIQNADDARAGRCDFWILEQGFSIEDTENTLFHGPALLVVNDGPLRSKDFDALPRAMGGSKSSDLDKVGRFGLGLKSIFHLCEAFIFMGADAGVFRKRIVNPWATEGGKDPRVTDWNLLDTAMEDRLKNLFVRVLPRSNQRDEPLDGFMLWIPLRQPIHRERRAEHSPMGLADNELSTETIANWFHDRNILALALAQCHSVGSVAVYSSISPEKLADANELAKVWRDGEVGATWMGRHTGDENHKPFETFGGTIESRSGERWLVHGVEVVGLRGGVNLRKQVETGPPGVVWPSELVGDPSNPRNEDRKALAHAAITTLMAAKEKDRVKAVRFRWAVYYPLDDAPNADNPPVVELAGPSGPSEGAWEILLHGYFWPSQDRRSIPGVTDASPVEGDPARVSWNKAVRDRLVLPMLPRVLAEGLKIHEFTSETARLLVGAVKSSRLFDACRKALTSEHMLLPVLAEGGVEWKAIPSGVSVVSLPEWERAPAALKRVLLDWKQENVVLTDATFPHLVGFDLVDQDSNTTANDDRLGTEWPTDLLESSLDAISASLLADKATRNWLFGFLRLVRPQGGEARVAFESLLARFLVKWTSEGLFDKVSPEARTDIQDLFSLIESPWLVRAPIGAKDAVKELAELSLEDESLFGPGLLVIPLGRKESEAAGGSEPFRILASLQKLARLMGDDLAPNERLSSANEARVSLSESLLLTIDAGRQSDFEDLRLIRVTSLPAGHSSVWSLRQIRSQSGQHLIFSTEHDEEGKSFSDPRQAILDLAEAVGQEYWLVSRAMSKHFDNLAPGADQKSIIEAVMVADHISSSTKKRNRLLTRLSKASGFLDQTGEFEDAKKKAFRRVLLDCRHPSGADYGIYFDRGENATLEFKALRVLLGALGRTQAIFDGDMVDDVSVSFLKKSGLIENVDKRHLHDVLSEVFETKDFIWGDLSDVDANLLIRVLYSADDPDCFSNWKSMPLHRVIDGTRKKIDDNTGILASGLSWKMRLPSQLVLLEPPKELKSLYEKVVQLTNDDLLRHILKEPNPWEWVSEIRELVGPDAPETIKDKVSLEGLRECNWLPARQGVGGIAPTAVLNLVESVVDALGPLLDDGMLGTRVLPSAIDAEVWAWAKDVKGLYPGGARRRALENLPDALKQSSLEEKLRAGAFLIAHSTDAFLEQSGSGAWNFIEDGLACNLDQKFSGWRLLKSVKEAAKIAAEDAQRSIIESMAEALCGPISYESQVQVLEYLAEGSPPKESLKTGFYVKLASSFWKTSDFQACVLPGLSNIPTRKNGFWAHPSAVAKTGGGLLDHYLIHEGIKESSRLTVFTTEKDENSNSKGLAESLRDYFSPWGSEYRALIGSFIALLGDGSNGSVKKMAEKWLPDDVSIESIRDSVVGSGFDWPSVIFKFQAITGQTVETFNLLGSVFKAERAETDSLFALDILKHKEVVNSNFQKGKHFFNKAEKITVFRILLKKIDVSLRNPEDLKQIIHETARIWMRDALGVGSDAWDAFMKASDGTQATIDSARIRMFWYLPQTLQQLDVRGNEELAAAQKHAERSKMAAEQEPESKKKRDDAKCAQDHLIELIEEREDIQDFVLSRIRAKIKQAGYGKSSVLSELAQNADDALVQRKEMNGDMDPSVLGSLGRVTIFLDSSNCLNFVHYGRPINEFRGSDFEDEGRRRQWDLDLYHMLNMNGTSKFDSLAGGGKGADTTGHFGLGFKSVYLISDAPHVESGFLSFRIAGGLLPLSVPKVAPIFEAVKGYQPTCIRLPIADGVSKNEIFEKFAYAKHLIPVFAKQIRIIEIQVDGEQAATFSFDAQDILDADGWQVAKAPSAIGPNDESFHLVRFRPSGKDMGGGALALGLRDGLPSPFPANLPFLWSVAPTGESWGCGYAIQGPFKLDPGRSHVALDDAASQGCLGQLGLTLGRALVRLWDSVSKHGVADSGFPRDVDADRFLAELWWTLSGGLGQADQNRDRWLRVLHQGTPVGTRHGLLHWMVERPSTPSGLGRPFKPFLPKLGDVEVVSVVGDQFSDTVLACLNNIGAAASWCKGKNAVSPKVEAVLKLLLQQDSLDYEVIAPSDVLKGVLSEWGGRLSVDGLRELRILEERQVWPAFEGFLRDTSLVALDSTGCWRDLSRLLLPSEVPVHDDFSEEVRLSGFAPPEWILQSDYVPDPLHARAFRKLLRVGFKVSDDNIIGWIAAAKGKEQQLKVLRYLIEGDRARVIFSRAVDSAKWLRDFDGVRLLLQDWDHSEREVLLHRIFPSMFEIVGVKSAKIVEVPGSFQKFLSWWEGSKHSKIQNVELGFCGLNSLVGDDDRKWLLSLLVIGAAHSAGRVRDVDYGRLLSQKNVNGLIDFFAQSDNLHDMDSEELKKHLDGLVVGDFESEAIVQYDHLKKYVFLPLFQSASYLDEYVGFFDVSNWQSNIDPHALLNPKHAPSLYRALGQVGYHFVLREIARVNGPKDKVPTGLIKYCFRPIERTRKIVSALGGPKWEWEDSSANSYCCNWLNSLDTWLDEMKVPDKSFGWQFDRPFLALADDHEVQVKIFGQKLT